MRSTIRREEQGTSIIFIHFNSHTLINHMRANRQKIDEPDTPYEYAVEEEEEEKTAPIEFNELAAKLDTLKRQRDEGLTDDDVKKKKFEDKRKNHYNMGARMRAMKEQMKREEEEEARLAAATTEKTD